MSQRFYSRRELLTRCGGGIASLALADLMRGLRSTVDSLLDSRTSRQKLKPLFRSSAMAE